MKTLLTSIRMFIVFTILTGVLYPLVVTGLAQAFFSDKANGSMISVGGKEIGSALIGQEFTVAKYFWPRPSAVGYNPLPSGATNLGPTSALLQEQISGRKEKLLKNDVGTAVPQDLLTASASGLDPDITPDGALCQIDHIMTARGLPEAERSKLTDLVHSYTELPQWDILGQARVNVLKLNLALDSLYH